MHLLLLVRFLVLLALVVGIPASSYAQFWRKKQASADSVSQAANAKAPEAATSAAQPWPSRNFPGNRYYIGVGFGGVQYTGDLTTRDGTQGFGPAVNVSFGFGGRKLLSTTFNLGYAQFSADDPQLNPLGNPSPNTYVSTSYFYLEGLVRARFRREKRIRPHIGLGLGYLRFTAEDQRGNNLADQLSTRSFGEVVSSGALQLPLNIGLVVDVTDRFAISLDYYRILPFTDYLDNIAELGPDSGNDVLNRLQVSLLIGLN